MRVYHLVSSQYGLDNLRRKRLKVATLNELNDPFDFLGVYLADRKLRRSFNTMKKELSASHGLLCFSKSWENPVLWSHYAENHKGICLGFDIPDEILGEVNYSPTRLEVDDAIWSNPNSVPPDEALKLLFTKYEHWDYENEVRCFVSLENKDSKSGFYFADFSENLKLTSVIIGAESEISRKTLSETLGDLEPTVKCIKARLAFKSFKVVVQQNEKLWK